MALPPPVPVYNPASPTNPNLGFSTESGASGIQDWWVHVQTVDIMYVRRNQYNGDTSSTLTAPAVTSNYLDMNCTVQTQNEVYYNVAFSSVGSSSTGQLFDPHVLQVQTAAASGGFGETGVISTSAMGIIRRPVRKDAAGDILDPTGICTRNVNLVVDEMPGAYEITFDTSGTVNGILAQAMGQLAVKCPSFKATLVDL
tara:strand:- start:106 stop:702 length:597 start_codon:yes stop_codon:yes gene_type:complete